MYTNKIELYCMLTKVQFLDFQTVKFQRIDPSIEEYLLNFTNSQQEILKVPI